MAIQFDEQWLKSYTARTGLGAREYARPSEGQESPSEGQARRKYGNKKTTRHGITFDSKHEADIYDELLLRARAGEYTAIARQVPFQCAEQVKYIADFVALRSDGRYEVIDAKSEATKRDKVYKIKKKLMLEKFGIEIIEL